MSTILVVDDSSTMRMKCSQILKHHGFTVYEADNGEVALQKVEEVNPDVILLDIIMPKMDGYEVLRVLKNDEKYNKIPVILITVKAEGDDIVTGLNEGADDYVSKPFREQELVARVNAMVRVKYLFDKLTIQNQSLQKVNTELYNAHQTILEQEKISLVGQLMVGIHHELRNPLAAALSDAQIVLKFFRNEGEQFYFVSDIEEQLQRMKEILNNIFVKDTIELEEYIDGIQMVKLK